jgi:hypothetical protein
MIKAIDANARRARVLELLRQAVMMQIHMWDLQTRLERAVLDGAEMNDAGSDEDRSGVACGVCDSGRHARRLCPL